MSMIELNNEKEFVVNKPGTQPVTKRERWGFYAYGFGSEPFAAVVMAVCAPVILETLTALISTDIHTGLPCDTTQHDYKCTFKLGALQMSPSSFALYVTAVSVVIQAITFVGLSALADHGNNRKYMLLFSGAVSAIFCILFLTVVNPGLYWLAAIFTIGANVAFGASYIFYYAYVPTLTQFDPEVLEINASVASDEEKTKVTEKVANRVSSLGFASGYLGAIICLLVSAGIIFGMKSPEYGLQVASAFNGVWYLVFLYFTWKWLQPRPGPPLPKGERYIFYSWKMVFHTISQAPKLSQAFAFLISWFLMSDALATIVHVAVLFAKASLGFSQLELFIAAFITPLLAGIGCIIWLYVQKFFNLRTRTMILILSVLYLVIPIYGVISIYKTNVLRSKVELYIVAGYHGLLLGAIQSFYRSLFSEMLPPGKENEFFGLYEITDKGSSWIGPLVVGAITDATGEIRYGFYFLLCSMSIPLILTYLVNVEKGKQQAKDFIDPLHPKVRDEVDQEFELRSSTTSAS